MAESTFDRILPWAAGIVCSVILVPVLITVVWMAWAVMFEVVL